MKSNRINRHLKITREKLKVWLEVSASGDFRKDGTSVALTLNEVKRVIMALIGIKGGRKA